MSQVRESSPARTGFAVVARVVWGLAIEPVLLKVARSKDVNEAKGHATLLYGRNMAVFGLLALESIAPSWSGVGLVQTLVALEIAYLAGTAVDWVGVGLGMLGLKAREDRG